MMANSIMNNEKRYKMIREEAYSLCKELIEAAGLKKGKVLVVGCSTSEVCGERIGTASKPEVAENLFLGIKQAADEAGVYIAAQCCEHLNRALIIEEELAEKLGIDTVNVVPQPKAGGSLATMAYKYATHPVAVEHIKADAGMDIGDTLIGMHLKDVAVPVRIKTDTVGSAHIVCAKTRPKLIGGERAEYC